MQTPFVKAPEDYGRDLNILKTARHDAATFLSKMRKIPYEEALKFVTEQTTEGGDLAIRDPQTMVLERDENCNREKVVMPFSQYLKDVAQNRWLISPTMAVYQHPDVKRSILSEYISGNVQMRSKVKKEGQVAKQEKDFSKSAICHVLQSTYKIKNNSLSGAHSSPHNALYLKSAHSTLTSTCRSATSYSNGNTERFLMGNRHYWSYDITVNNVISIINLTDYPLLQECMDHYKLHYPTPEEVIEAIHYSCKPYWRNPLLMLQLEELIRNLEPIERAAFMYTQDCYQLAKFNDEVVRRFIGSLAGKATVPLMGPEADEVLGKMDEDMAMLVGQICGDELMGTYLGELKKTGQLEKYGIVAATAQNIMSTLDEYSLLIRALWRTDSVPASMASFPNSMRRSVIVSDTDSTIFTVQDWTAWYSGKVAFDPMSKAVAATMVYLTSMTTIHLLAQLSANMGVAVEKIHQLAMKSEFSFPIMGLTNKSKHYYSYISACEGNVYEELETEYKGVTLKNSKIPNHVMDKLDQLIRKIMDSTMNGEQISLAELSDFVAKIEKDCGDSLRAGHIEYLSLSSVKAAASYKNPESSPFVHYDLWNSVFARKYGQAAPPPYGAVKVSLKTTTPTAMERVLRNLSDQQMAEDMRTWLKGKGKSHMTQILVPLDLIKTNGVPKEIVEMADIRKVQYTVSEAAMLVLDSLGLSLHDKNNTKLISDFRVV